MTRWSKVTLLLFLTTPALTGAATAQRLRLTLNSGAPIAFPVVTEADYDAGSVTASAPLAFTLSLTGGAANTDRTGILSIRASAAVMGGTKPIGDMQWRRSDLGVWNSLTTADVVVESHTMRRSGLNNPWSNSVEFRALLDWSTDGAATYTPTIILTATLTTP